MGQLLSGRPPGRAVARTLRKQLEAADRILARLAAGEPEVTAHAVRRKLKKAVSLLAMLQVSMGKARHARQAGRLRQIARALAGRRRAEAMVEIVAKLGIDCAKPREKAAIQALERQLQTRLELARGARPVSRDLANLRREIAALRRKARRWPLSGRDPSQLVEGMTLSYGRARKLVARALSSGNPRTLHQARKSVIHHLHHIEFLTPLWPAVLRPLAEELLALRTVLGDVNDFEELARLVKRNKAAPLANGQTRLCLAAIRRQRRRLVATIAHRSAPLFADKPGAFARRTTILWRTATT